MWSAGEQDLSADGYLAGRLLHPRYFNAGCIPYARLRRLGKYQARAVAGNYAYVIAEQWMYISTFPNYLLQR